MKLKSKKMATLLIAIFMISAFAFASASPGITLTTDGLGTARIENERVELWIPAYDPDRLYDEARVVFDYDSDLNSITGVSFQSYVTGFEGNYHPAVVLVVDFEPDGTPDAWVVQFIWTGGPNAPSHDEWREISFDESSPVHVAGNRKDLPTHRYAPYGPPLGEGGTLEELRLELFEGSTYWGDLQVVEVKVMIGAFTVLPEPMSACVDDVNINDLLYYDFNLISEGPVSLTANSVAKVDEIRISVNPTEVDFGKIVEGESVTDTVTITNKGTVAELIQAELQGEVPAEFFTKNLKLDEDVPVADWSIPSLAVDMYTGVDLTLSIPEDTEAGIKTAVLIFWAEQA